METNRIGNKITKARKKINISQAQLAEQLFISPQAVGKWERGESLPDLITVNRLAEILGVDLNYFSENLQSEANESDSHRTESAEPQQPTELPSDRMIKERSWDMSRENLVDADFSGLKNLHEKFVHSNMQRCLFVGSDMSGLLLRGNNVDGCDFSSSNISNSQIHSSNLANNVFKDCSLKETEFSRSFIDSCDFSGADFTGAKFNSAGLGNSATTQAVWNRTSFIESQIADIVLEGALEDCYFENCVFSRVTFRNATLTNTFFKNNRKLKQIRFIDCKADKLTYAFLKNGKANLTGITLLTE